MTTIGFDFCENRELVPPFISIKYKKPICVIFSNHKISLEGREKKKSQVESLGPEEQCQGCRFYFYTHLSQIWIQRRLKPRNTNKHSPTGVEGLYRSLLTSTKVANKKG